MSNKIWIILLASLVLLTLTGYWGLRSGPSGAAASSVVSSSTGACRVDINSSYIQKLSNDTTEANQAAIKLLDLAKESSECRAVVINEVIGGLKRADLENDNSAFKLWAKGSAVLGQLKAVEALDLLIAHLDLSDGFFSASMVHEPVVLAMVRMGEVAVPKLAFALKHNPDKEIRLAAAYCLGDIGGSEALDAMKSALSSETEECVRRFITLTLPSPEETFDSNRPVTAHDGEVLRERLKAYRCGS